MIRRHRLSLAVASILIALEAGSGTVPAVLPGDSSGAAAALMSPGWDQAPQVTELLSDSMPGTPTSPG